MAANKMAWGAIRYAMKPGSQDIGYLAARNSGCAVAENSPG